MGQAMAGPQGQCVHLLHIFQLSNSVASSWFLPQHSQRSTALPREYRNFLFGNVFFGSYTSAVFFYLTCTCHRQTTHDFLHWPKYACKARRVAKKDRSKMQACAAELSWT